MSNTTRAKKKNHHFLKQDFSPQSVRKMMVKNMKNEVAPIVEYIDASNHKSVKFEKNSDK